MSNISDVVAIGSGHNGLVAAAYLARAGKKVTVLERNSWFGGGVVSRELTAPGFTHDQHSMAHIMIQHNPLLKNDELGLKSKYGLRYVYPDVPMISVFEDGQTIRQHKDRNIVAADIGKFSKKDAEAYLRLAGEAEALLPMLLGTLFSPPMPAGAGFMMMDQSREGRDVWRMMQLSTHDLLREYFEHERTMIHLGRVAGEQLVSPDEKSTGIGVMMFVALMQSIGIGVPIGGSGALTAALVALIRDHGGEVIANVDVEKIIVKNGKAVGAATRDGVEYHARDAVIGAIHPHNLGAMIDGLDPAVDRAAKRTHMTDAACITLHASLNEPLRFKTSEPVDGVMIELVPDSYEQMRRAFDELRYGKLMATPMIGLGTLSKFDPSRVPEGKAIVHSWDYVPYDHPSGKSWDEMKEDYAQRMIAQMGRYIENMTPGNIIGVHIDSPLDMERTSPSFRRGDLHGVAQTSYQMGAHRPTPDLGFNTVPEIDGMYLVGPFQPPGGGVFGAGRATAIRIFDDLDLDFDKVTG